MHMRAAILLTRNQAHFARVLGLALGMLSSQKPLS